MDTARLKTQGLDFLKKYRFVILVLVAGLLLMALPDATETEPSTAAGQEEQTESVQDALAQILSRVQGAGKVEVLLTEYKGSETLYQTDTQQSADSLKSDTVLLSGSDRNESGLVRQINPPVYLGALIVCQGGDSPSVKLAIVEAVMRVTGLSSNQIMVLKMK